MDAGVRYFRAVRADRSIGTLAIRPAGADVHYLMRLAVLPRYRCRGLGARLVSHGCRQARQNGAAAVSVGIIAAQAELVAWYHRLGFHESGRQDFDHLPFAVLFLQLDLDTQGAPAERNAHGKGD
jgi:predicted N-acetyltransferase YhbS